MIPGLETVYVQIIGQWIRMSRTDDLAIGKP